MGQQNILQPSAEHPITIEPTAGHVVVRINGEVVADTRNALTLQESTYPAVQYIPFKDVAYHALTCTPTTTHCPYKGDATYYSVAVGDTVVDDAIWAYEHPYPAVAQIAGHVAFYPDKAEITISKD
ncbi:DUF427 domain-containing protein [Mycolicibacterium mengxianglii]|uniref:DUF427 domain-containing protein n=1 Tax=Mycolicibacterium mengxianglii TaxID=2736649 RepID=UPI0018D1ACD3|nr:DUF427 domain-containing protein [Mycolicibacterium mengxianglii]